MTPREQAAHDAWSSAGEDRDERDERDEDERAEDEAAARDEAIEVCLCAADTRMQGIDGADGPNNALAWEAWSAANDATPNDFAASIAEECACLWLEAAALLRGDDEHEPWSPGDPVYIRSKQGA